MSEYQSVPYAIVEIRRCPENAARCSLRHGEPTAIGDANRGLRCLDVAGRAAAADRLRAYVFQSGDIETLRRIAGQEDLTSLQLTDHQVVEQVAALVERRTVCLLGSVIARSASFGVKEAPPAAAPRPSATGLPPSRHHPRTEPRAPAPAADDSIEVDDAQQVAVLEEAAKDGVPFCEECEKAHQRPHDHGSLGERPARRDAPSSATAPNPLGTLSPSPGPPTDDAERDTGFAGKGFRSEEHLRVHYDKHGHEFGAESPQEYLALAQALRDCPLGPRVIEAVRADGVITRFDRDTGAFIAFEPDGNIRTFFKPQDGEAYFRRQRDRPA